MTKQSKLAVYLHGKNARVQAFQESGLHIVYFERPFYPLFTCGVERLEHPLPITLTRFSRPFGPHFLCKIFAIYKKHPRSLE